MKEKLMAVKVADRSVELWNEMREEFKTQYPENEISKLDASGYISKWLKGE